MQPAPTIRFRTPEPRCTQPVEPHPAGRGVAQSLRPTGTSVEGVPEMKDFVPERFDIRTMAVRNFPDRWAPWDTQKIIGDIFNAKLNLPCPVLQTVCGIIPGQEISESKAGYKFARTSSLAEGKGVKLVPKLRIEAAEWQFIQDRVKQGEKLVSCYYAVSILAPNYPQHVNPRMAGVLRTCLGNQT